MAKETMDKKKHISKEDVILWVRELNVIIRSISEENCYDLVIDFYERTSKLDDYWVEIRNLSLKGINVFGIKSKTRKQAEAGRSLFFRKLRNVSRDMYGENRTEPGETVTKDKVYFGDIDGTWTFSVAELEKATKDEYLQSRVRAQIVQLVKGYNDVFNTNWLK